MKTKLSNGVLLLTLALIFTIGLTFASIELPNLADKYLQDNYNYVNVYTGGGDLQDSKTELFLKHYSLRTIGYFCLAAIILMIAAGFITDKSGLSSLGAFALFMPVFGHFAATMFFLGGLGFLRLLWMPVLDISFNIMSLGDVIFIPYRLVIEGLDMTGINLREELPYIFIITGLIIFCTGTVTWFYTYFNKSGIAEIWVYKFSRHPQYLGWIIWSYGILFLPGANMKNYFELSDSLPWLLSTMIIITIALMEELKMEKVFGEKYLKYRQHSYFMLPLPKFISTLISFPMRKMIGKDYPSNKKEIFLSIFLYLSMTIVSTVILNTYLKMKEPGKWVIEREDTRSIEMLADEFINNPDRRQKYYLYEKMVEKGEPSIPYFIKFLSHNEPVIREFSADAMWKLAPEPGIPALIKALSDDNFKVRNSAIRALGSYKSDSAVDPLIKLLNDENIYVRGNAAAALSNIKTEKATEALLRSAEEEMIPPSAGLVSALENYKSERSENYIVKLISSNDNNIRHTAIIAVMNMKSVIAKDALKKALHHQDWETRIYAEEALSEIE